MPGRPAWLATPRGRRSISQIASALAPLDTSRARLALLVGAGVDRSLAARPTWNDLLGCLGKGIAVGGSSSHEGLARCAGEWPMEAAEAIRLTLGPETFTAALREALPLRTSDDLASSPLAQAIAKLIERGVATVVSLNYTDDLVLALRERLHNSVAVRVIDRAEMSAWPVGRILTPEPGEIHVLKLHGSLQLTDPLVAPEIVLDRSSYDAALVADSPYRIVLSRLFEDFAVLSVGVSWVDVPLRDAAARARRQLPVARTMHYTTRQHSGDGPTDWWEERALTASYGLRPLYYVDHSEAAGILDSIAQLVDSSRGPAPNAIVEDIADWLDSVGDYESQQQSTWFAANWRTASEIVKSACEPSMLTAENWLAAARIERHLRHFIWFWLSASERVAFREELWNAIAEGWNHLSAKETEPMWQNERVSCALNWDVEATAGASGRALLDFAFGAYEIHGRNIPDHRSVTGWVDRLDRTRRSAPNSLAGLRIAVASKVWTMDASVELMSMARDSCWEGMEAKLALDITEKRLRAKIDDSVYETPRDLPGRVRDALWLEIDHVRELSRVAGVNRREAAAIVLGSFLAPALKAEADLVATYRRLRDLSSGQMEPGSAWSVVFGLIAIFVDQARNYSDHELIDPICAFLNDKCKEIPINDEILSAVETNYARYWHLFHRRAANLAPRVAARLLQSID